MKTTIAVFASSMFFGIIVSVSYWYSTYEPVGTILLGIMSAGFLFAASYTGLAQRKVKLVGDRKNPPPASGAEYIGIFTTESAWPILLAVSSAIFLIGMVLQPWAAGIGGIVFLYAMIMMIRESNL